MHDFPQILLVEDDSKLAQLMSEYLSQHNYVVSVESRGDSAVDRVQTEQPDCVVLDIGLPGLDGFEVCRQVRHGYANPILMLTARGDDIDEILGLELGADDYLAKPVQPKRLLTRIKALLRRAHYSTTGNRKIQFGHLKISPSCRSVSLSGTELELTTSEYDLLYYLAIRAGIPVSRAELHQQLRGLPYDDWIAPSTSR